MEHSCKATVLVVDDDAELRDITAQMLTVEGYRAMEANGASEAVGVLSKHEVDVLLTDFGCRGSAGSFWRSKPSGSSPTFM
jgi:DNA-binding NtrC family response regulator